MTVDRTRQRKRLHKKSLRHTLLGFHERSMSSYFVCRSFGMARYNFVFPWLIMLIYPHSMADVETVSKSVNKRAEFLIVFVILAAFIPISFSCSYLCFNPVYFLGRIFIF
ncbi:hypothetical protein CLU79DRAFT_747750 [Phycomyces nitens]|nr:hypothetical protein CLU79DRAFT_747750 [Phycomyces nitens]